MNNLATKIIGLLLIGILITSVASFLSFSLTKNNDTGFFGFAAILALSFGVLAICGIVFGILVGISKIIWYHAAWILLLETILTGFIFMIMGGAPKDFGNIIDVLPLTASFFLSGAVIAFVIVRIVKWFYFKKSRIVTT